MIARWLARLQGRPRALVGAGLVLLGLAVASASRIRVETDLFRLLPADVPGLAELLDAAGAFGAMDAAFGLLEADTAEEARAYADAFTHEAARSPRVIYAVARFPVEEMVARGVPPEAVFFVGPEVLQEVRGRLDPRGFPAVAARLRRVLLSPTGARAAPWLQRDPLGVQVLLGRGLAALPRPGGLDPRGYLGREVEGRYRVLVPVRPATPPGDLAFSQAFMADLRAAEERARLAAGPAGGGLRAGFTGGHAVAVEEAEALRTDIAGTLALSLAGVLAVFWAFFRRGRVVAALGACLVASLAAGLGLLGLYPGRLHAVTAGFAAALCGLAVDYGIHVYNGVCHRRPEGLEEMYRVVGRSVAFGALTTAAAFLALAVSRFPGMREFGLTMAAGVGAALAVMTTVFVPLAGAPRPLPQGSGRLAARWEAWAWRHRRGLVIGVGAAVVLVCWAGWPRATFEPNLRRLAASGETWRVQEEVLELFGNRLEPLVFRWRGEDPAEGLAAMDRLRERARGAPGVDHVETPLLFRPTPAGAEAARAALADLNPDRLCGELKQAVAGAGLVPDAFGGACDALDALVAAARLPPHKALTRSLAPAGLGAAWEDRFVARGGTDLAAYVYPSRRLTDPEEAETLARELGADGPGWTVSGIGILTGPLRTLLAGDLARSTLLTCALVAAAALGGVRSARRAALALLPAAVAAAVTLGALGLLGIPLNPMNFVAVPLVLGLGIDDGLHLVTQAWQRPGDSVSQVLAESGRAISCTTATTLAGFGALLAARHSGLVSLGALVCLGVAAAWLTTVVLLPPLLRWSRDGRP